MAKKNRSLAMWAGEWKICISFAKNSYFNNNAKYRPQTTYRDLAAVWNHPISMNIRLLASSLGLSLTIGDIWWCRREERKFISTYSTLIIQIFDAHRAVVAAKLSMHACLLYTLFKAIAALVGTGLAFTTLEEYRTNLQSGPLVYALYDKSLRLAFLFGFSQEYKLGLLIITQYLSGSIISVFQDQPFPRVHAVLSHFEKDVALERQVVFQDTFVILVAVITARPANTYLFIFPTLIAVTSCLACHAVVDIHRLGDQSPSKVSEEMVFTTIGTTWDSQTHIDPA
ncbi:hypothetical protein L218DRAFT_948362 [Marasmius fiardii PR-910]|nr:hypothetical protein L218DRAFT_948362 [Marasmius fiardii PR-910]